MSFDEFLMNSKSQSERAIESYSLNITNFIYVANEYPNFAEIMSMVSQKLTLTRQITLNVRQNLSVLMENMQILG